MIHTIPLLLALAAGCYAHTSAFVEGMYCKGGPDPNNYNANARDTVNPLYELPMDQWWMQAVSGCLNNPPAENESLALPAGGSFTVELAHNQAQTTLSYDGKYTSEWPDGKDHPDDWAGPGSPPGCIQDDGAMHTNNQSMATGTAWAISYESEISNVTMDNLVVFSVLEHTPWKRLATYEVPKDLPECPKGGCYCAWLWIAPYCGQPNEYMSNFRCHVTNTTSTKKLAQAQPPVYCEDDESKCVKGAKQMLVWHQQEGNNFELEGDQKPGYSKVMGYSPGAQNDIFE